MDHVMFPSPFKELWFIAAHLYSMPITDPMKHIRSIWPMKIFSICTICANRQNVYVSNPLNVECSASLSLSRKIWYWPYQVGCRMFHQVHSCSFHRHPSLWVIWTLPTRVSSMLCIFDVFQQACLFYFWCFFPKAQHASVTSSRFLLFTSNWIGISFWNVRRNKRLLNKRNRVRGNLRFWNWSSMALSHFPSVTWG